MKIDIYSIRGINTVSPEQSESSPFPSLLATLHHPPQVLDELALIPKVYEDLPGDWTYTAGVIDDPDNVRFFQKTRVFTLQHYIQLLSARHRFSEALRRSVGAWPGTELQPLLKQITKCQCTTHRDWRD